MRSAREIYEGFPGVSFCVAAAIGQGPARKQDRFAYSLDPLGIGLVIIRPVRKEAAGYFIAYGCRLYI
jgi:hypothetical protein